MDEALRNEIIEGCKNKCTCGQYHGQFGQKRESQSGKEENDDQRTFISFLTETVSVVAFIFLGSVVFWLAVGGILFDFFKRLYYSDRYVKLFVAGLFTFLVLSMSVRLYLNKRACRVQYIREQMAVNKNVKVEVVTQPPPTPAPPKQTEYLSVSLKDKSLLNKADDEKLKEKEKAQEKGKNKDKDQDKAKDKDKDKDKAKAKDMAIAIEKYKDIEKTITKKFTLTIMNEKKKEVFKTTKAFLIPEELLESNKNPALVFFLKEVTLEDY